MGIEPTNHSSSCGSTGFEDQACHQAGRASAGNYTPRDILLLFYFNSLYKYKTEVVAIVSLVDEAESRCRRIS